MKLTVTQIILGILIVLTASYVLWWMISGVNPLLDDKVPGENGTVVRNYTPENETLFTAARYTTGLLSALGLAVVVTAVLWKKSENKRALAVTQIIAGTLIVAVSTLILIWGYSFDFIAAIEGGPVLDLARARTFTLLTDGLGLVILVLGLIQLEKSGKIMTS